jgi:integrase
MPRRRRPLKQPNGEGSVYELPDGRFKVAVTVGRTPDGKPRRRTKIFKKRSDAEAHRRKLLGLRDSGKLGPADRRTLSDYLDRWLRSAATGGLRGTTAESYSSLVRRHVSPHIGHLRLERVTTADVRGWLDTLAENGVGSRSRQYAFTVLSAALSGAAEAGDVRFNPCGPIDRPEYEREPIDPFTADESRAILTASEACWNPAVFMLGFSPGLRQGEIFGLRWRDLDLDVGRLSVKQQLVEGKGGVRFHPPKSKAGFRTLDLTPATVDALREHRRFMLRKGWASSEVVFLTRRGTLVRRSNFGDRHWGPLLKRCKLRHRGFHHARHTFATLMLGAGVPIHVVSKLLGHSSVTITLENYAHYVPDQGRNALDASRALFG